MSRGDIIAVHDRLADAGAAGREGFTAVFTPPAFEAPALQVNTYRFTAKLSYHGKPFDSVPIEISPVEAGNADAYDEVGSPALPLIGLPTNEAVPCMTVPWQIAQKMHACTEPVKAPQANDRAHNLVDLQLLEALVPNDSLALIRGGVHRSVRDTRRANVATERNGPTTLGSDLRPRLGRSGGTRRCQRGRCSRHTGARAHQPD